MRPDHHGVEIAPDRDPLAVSNVLVREGFHAHVVNELAGSLFLFTPLVEHDLFLRDRVPTVVKADAEPELVTPVRESHELAGVPEGGHS